MRLRISKLFEQPQPPPALRVWQALIDESGLGDAETVALLQFALAHCHQSHAQGMQDIWALFEHGEKRGGYYVEFGAANGVERNRAGDRLDALMAAHGYERRFPLLSQYDNWYRLAGATT